jgi:hypothetical protein
MSRTKKDSDSRSARIFDKKRLNIYNSGHRECLNEIQNEINSLQVNGIRYGNHRKMKAKEKVRERRSKRHFENRSFLFNEDE